ncbi:MAG: pyridoxal-dependent decarboxylase [Lachnospiraceae bacterium]|nr:pyridoxal-dependent decarboxylase [Lachnospiraceae bacterium]
MKLDSAVLKQLSEEFGEAFYLLDSAQFKQNYLELKQAFSNLYPKFNIAYSYKTNYIPKLCRIVDGLGGCAEVVSEMELDLALRIGVRPENIIWNGPVKEAGRLEAFLLSGGNVNLDSLEEAEAVKAVAGKHEGTAFKIGLRCSFDIRDGGASRFGFDTEGEDWKKVLVLIQETPNLSLQGLQCHFAKRQMAYWPARVQGMLDLVERTGILPERIDLGGGLFGKMEDSLKEQFDSPIPSYAEYAEASAGVLARQFEGKEKKPELFIEPGSALAGDCMKFAGTVKTIKKMRGKWIAAVLGSQKNISMAGVNPPLRVYAMGGRQKAYEGLDFAGYTCIESDILYRNYRGPLACGDMAVFGNCGSYSLVMKPPFILPNFPVVDIAGEKPELVKRGETFDDVFHTFCF